MGDEVYKQSRVIQAIQAGNCDYCYGNAQHSMLWMAVFKILCETNLRWTIECTLNDRTYEFQMALLHEGLVGSSKQ